MTEEDEEFYSQFADDRVVMQEDIEFLRELTTKYTQKELKSKVKKAHSVKSIKDRGKIFNVDTRHFNMITAYLRDVEEGCYPYGFGLENADNDLLKRLGLR